MRVGGYNNLFRELTNQQVVEKASRYVQSFFNNVQMKNEFN